VSAQRTMHMDILPKGPHRPTELSIHLIRRR